MSEQQSSCAATEPKSDAVEYRDIAGFPGYRVGSDGSVWNIRRNKRLKCALNDFGYTIAILKNVQRRKIKCRVHVLVLKAFAGPCPDGMEALHGPDHDKQNNKADNLRWGTHAENMLELRTRKHPAHKYSTPLSRETADAIRQLVLSGKSMGSVARQFGVSHTSVRRIIRGERWNNL